MILTNAVKRAEQIKFFKEQLEGVPLRNIISVDETSVDSHIQNNTGWSKSGKRITTTTVHKKSPLYSNMCSSL